MSFREERLVQKRAGLPRSHLIRDQGHDCYLCVDGADRKGAEETGAQALGPPLPIHGIRSEVRKGGPLPHAPEASSPSV